MAAFNLAQFFQLKKKAPTGGTSVTANFNPSLGNSILAIPTYQEHTADIYSDRIGNNTKVLLKTLFKSDPDVSAAVNAYMTMANTFPIIKIKDVNGELYRQGYPILYQLMQYMFRPLDRTQGFIIRQDFHQICADLRYMILLRGGCAGELVFDKGMIPADIRVVDLGQIEWKQPKAGLYKPQQRTPGYPQPIDLDIPTFFVSFFRRDPSEIYTNSTFVAAINTIAARAAIINELYRILQVTGYPRIDIEVAEAVVMNAAPADVQADPVKRDAYLSSVMQSIAASFASIRSDQAFAHTDSVKATILNDKNPGVAVDVSKAISVLDAQNQAALKTVASVIGRGDQGVNTASVEARVFSLNADEINEPLAEFWGNIFTMVLNSQGVPVTVDVEFRPAELRPYLELEAQRTMQAARLKQDLSLGIITDDEYHLTMYDRIRPDSAPELQGTGFMPMGGAPDASNASPNQDPLGRSLTGEGAQGVRSKTVPK